MHSYENSGHRSIDCPLTAKDLFDKLSGPDRQRLRSLKHHRHIEKDAKVFVEGEQPQYIYILRDGNADLLPAEHRGPGSQRCPFEPEPVFGVIEALSESPFDSTLVASTPCEFDLITRADFLDLLLEQPDICFALVKTLSRLYQRVLRSATSN